MIRAASVAVAAGLLIVAFAGCGGSTSRAKAPSTRAGSSSGVVNDLKARLGSAGYRLEGRVVSVRLKPRPGGAFAVRDVDFASPHPFSVAIYLFPSAGGAAEFAAAAERRLVTNRTLSAKDREDYSVRSVGSHVYFGFTSMSPGVCEPFGLCDSFAIYGPFPTCNASGTCSGGGPAPLPKDDFDRLVARGR